MTLEAALAIAVLLVAATPATAQRPEPPVGVPETETALVLVGAVAGSLTGALLWIDSAGDGPGDAVLGWAATSVGSALGARLLAGRDTDMDFTSLLVGSTVGMFAGIGLGWAVGAATDSPSYEGLLLTFSVGQGVITTVLGRSGA